MCVQFWSYMYFLKSSICHCYGHHIIAFSWCGLISFSKGDWEWLFLKWLIHLSQPLFCLFNCLNLCFSEEEEFLGELADSHLNESIFNRDQVFAHLNFRLDAGSFKLVNTKHKNTASQTTTVLPVIEVEFSDLRWDSEMRPRSSTWEFSMSLGALFVRDKLTAGTLFPALVCPQGRESQVCALFSKCSLQSCFLD